MPAIEAPVSRIPLYSDLLSRDLLVYAVCVCVKQIKIYIYTPERGISKKLCMFSPDLFILSINLSSEKKARDIVKRIIFCFCFFFREVMLGMGWDGSPSFRLPSSGVTMCC